MNKKISRKKKFSLVLFAKPDVDVQISILFLQLRNSFLSHQNKMCFLIGLSKGNASKLKKGEINLHSL